MGSNDINAAIRQPTPKPSLVRLGKLSATGDIHAKPIEMNVLALDHADDHPAERSQMTGIKTIEFRIDSDIETAHHKDGKLETLIWLFCMVTYQPRSSSASLLAFASA